MRSLVAVVLFAFASAAAVAQDRTDLSGPLSIARQGSFFVGGREVRSDTLSTVPAYASTGTVVVDQMYVRFQVPAGQARLPVVMVHGCCLTGKTWETTPDGRMGWDEYFVRRGHPSYVVDQAWRGRSAADASTINAVKTGKLPPEKLPVVFAAGIEAAWAIFRFGQTYPDAFPGMRFPKEGVNELAKQMVPDYLQSLPTPNPTVPALSALAQQLGSAVLMSHSQSGIYPFQTARLSPKGIAAIVSVEPGTCPAPTDDVAAFKDVPILVVFGDFVEQSQRWAPRLVNCRAFVAAVNAAGGKADLLDLPARGIKGNTHMLMQDDNSLEIGAMLADWIDAKARK